LGFGFKGEGGEGGVYLRRLDSKVDRGASGGVTPLSCEVPWSYIWVPLLVVRVIPLTLLILHATNHAFDIESF
jgi:hypothetical protein